jgi:hypothetical protein
MKFYVYAGIIALVLLAFWWTTMRPLKEGYDTGAPILLTGAMSIGEPESGAYALEGQTVYPAFSLNIDRLGYVPNIQTLQNGLASGNAYNVSVTGSPSDLTYNFELATVNTEGTPPNVATLENKGLTKSSTLIFSGDRTLMFKITPKPRVTTAPASEPPAAPSFLPLTLSSAPSLPDIRNWDISGASTGITMTASGSGIHGPASWDMSGSSFTHIQPAVVRSSRNASGGNLFLPSTDGFRGPAPVSSTTTWTSPMHSMVTRNNAPVYKSSLVPCSCPAFSMNCPIHAGSQPASQIPGDTAAGLTRTQNQFDVMRPFTNTPDDVPGFLNSFSSFNH